VTKQKNESQEIPVLAREWKEPALYVTTQSTLPTRIASLLAVSLAVMGFASNTGWSSIALPLLRLTTKDVAFFLLGISVLALSSAAEACVKSHAWDYFALSEERRKFEKISTRQGYIEYCYGKKKLGHRRAVRDYRIGFYSVLFGMSFLLWPVSRTTSLLMATCTFVLIVRMLNEIVEKRKLEELHKSIVAEQGEFDSKIPVTPDGSLLTEDPRPHRHPSETKED